MYIGQVYYRSIIPQKCDSDFKIRKGASNKLKQKEEKGKERGDVVKGEKRGEK